MNYVINITEVKIIPYSSNSSAVPGQARITGQDEATLEFKHGTSFHLLSNFDLRISENIDDNPNFTFTEKERVLGTLNLILVLRASLHIENVDLHSDYVDIAANPLYIFPVYLQNRQITLKSLHIEISGTIMLMFDPLNLYLEHLDIACDRNSGGFEQHIYCHYPEAFLETLMYVNNVTMYYAVKKITNPVIHGSMRSESPGSYILSNFTSHIYFETNEAASIVTLHASKN